MQNKSLLVLAVVVVVFAIGAAYLFGATEAPSTASNTAQDVATPNSIFLKRPSRLLPDPRLGGPDASTIRRLAPPIRRPPELAQRPSANAELLARMRSTDESGASPHAVPEVLQGQGGGARFELDREGLRTAMQSGVEDIRRCYEDWLRMEPGLAGTLRVRFSIDSGDGIEGKVTSVSLVGDAGMGNVAMEGCVMSVVSDLRFEPPVDGPLNVTYPYVFVQTDAGR